MKKTSFLAASLAAISSPNNIITCFGFSSSPASAVRSNSVLRLKTNGEMHDEPKCEVEISRRSVISTALAVVTSTAAFRPLLAVNAQEEVGKNGKVVVYGGSGWVGAHVCSLLSQQGYGIASISRSSPESQLDRTKSILGASALPKNVEYISLDASTATTDKLQSSMKDAIAVISCVGLSPGSSNQKDGNGLVNTRIFQAAKAAGVPKVVYIGVSSSLANGPAKFLLGDYFQGKAIAEKSVTSEFGKANALIIKPAIIAGGTPGEIRPPGPPGVKPVDVKVVAKLVVEGAVGNLSGEIDGNDAIVAAVAVADE